jgi:energy-coupling factor transport system ATP-binding protein
MEPQTLILDEPTAGLDPAGRDDILGKIRELHGHTGNTVIIVSHSMEDVARLVNRIVVMNQGRLAMDGTPAEIFARGDALRAMGQDVPEAVRLAEALREKGFVIPASACLLEEVRDAIAAELGGKGPC